MNYKICLHHLKKTLIKENLIRLDILLMINITSQIKIFNRYQNNFVYYHRIELILYLILKIEKDKNQEKLNQDKVKEIAKIILIKYHQDNHFQLKPHNAKQ